MRQISNHSDQKTYFAVWDSVIGNHFNYILQNFLIENLLRHQRCLLFLFFFLQVDNIA